MTARVLGVLLLAALAVAGVRADDVASGPSVGDKVAPVKVLAVTGDLKDKEVDFSDERKDKPTVYIFVHEWNRPVGRLLKSIDSEVRKAFEDFHVVAVWLTDDVEKFKHDLPNVQNSLGFEATTLTISADGKAGPNNWGLNEMAHVTVVVAAKGKVVKSLGFVSTTEADARPVFEAIKKAKDMK
jgi:hypothetical protein